MAAPKGKTEIRDKLSTLEECCVQHYVANGGDQSKAYRACNKKAAKWKPATVWKRASELFLSREVQGRIVEVSDKLKDKYEVTTERLIREASIVAFADRRELFDEEGNLKPLSKIDDDVAKILSGIEVQMLPGDDAGHVHKIKTYDKMNAMEKLFKNKGLFEKDNDQQNPHKKLTDDEIDERIKALMNRDNSE